MCTRSISPSRAPTSLPSFGVRVKVQVHVQVQVKVRVRLRLRLALEAYQVDIPQSSPDVPPVIREPLQWAVGRQGEVEAVNVCAQGRGEELDAVEVGDVDVTWLRLGLGLWPGLGLGYG